MIYYMFAMLKSVNKNVKGFCKKVKAFWRNDVSFLKKRRMLFFKSQYFLIFSLITLRNVKTKL